MLGKKLMNMAESTANNKISGNSTSTAVAATIGSILIKTGKITSKDAERVIALQKQNGLRFGDTAKALGLIADADVLKALSYQFDFPYLDSNDPQFDLALYAAYQPFSAQTEALRNLRNQLLQNWFAENGKPLAIVSPASNEGRSSLTANLAIVFSQLGQRTLVVDADFRKPRQHELFKLDCNYGLADILAGRADSGVVKQIPVFGSLSVLTAGTMPPNPSELLSRGLQRCLQGLQTEFDIILVDTPQGGGVVDSRIVAPICGGAILLARQHQTRLNQLHFLKTSLQDAGCKCLGAVLADF